MTRYFVDNLLPLISGLNVNKIYITMELLYTYCRLKLAGSGFIFHSEGHTLYAMHSY